MHQFLAVVVALFSASGASAANWVHVADCGEPGQVRAYSYDSSSVERGRGTAIVRLKGDYSRLASSPVKEARIVWSIDCASRTFVETERTEYGANRRVLARYGDATAAMGVTRDSVAEKVFNRVCS